MNRVDVIELTQKAVAQAMGSEYMEQLGTFSELDSAKLADVGRDVSQAGTVEVYSHALLSLMGKFELMNDEYQRKIKSLYVDSFEWGGFIERTLIDLTEIIADPMWNLQSGHDYSDIENTFYGAKSDVLIFEEGKAIMSPISIVTEQLMESFRNWDELVKYNTGIRQQVKNTVNYALDCYERMLVACGIAVSSSQAGTNTARHLLTEAKALGIVESDVQPKDALNIPEYLAYVMEQIANTKDNIKEMSTAFNDKTMPIFAVETGTVLLSQFKNAVKFRLLQKSYNRDELSIGEYDTVGFWQGSNDGTNPSFDYAVASSISLAADQTNKLGIGTTAFSQSNILGVTFDKRAMGICLYKQKVTSNYTACADFFTEFTHNLINLLLDKRFGIVAYLND